VSAIVYHGDCLEVMRGMPDASVDAVVTDPPFGVRDEAWDAMTSREFARFTMAWLSEARRVSRELVVFCTADSAIRDLCKMLYVNTRQIIWHKPLGSQYAGASEARLWFSHEVVLHCHDRQPETVVTARDAAVGRMIRAEARKRACVTDGRKAPASPRANRRAPCSRCSVSVICSVLRSMRHTPIATPRSRRPEK
jgi:predicted RNA methylase